MNFKQWIAFLESLKSEGLKVVRHPRFSNCYAEIYKYNFATIQVFGRYLTDPAKIEQIFVQIYFDNELRDRESRTEKTFSTNELDAVRQFITEQKKKWKFHE